MEAGPISRLKMKNDFVALKQELNTYSASTTILCILLLGLTGNVFNEEVSKNLLDDRCLNCFCQALTKCNYSFGCLNEGKIVCGPYKLSLAFWLDGGKPGNKNRSSETEDHKVCSQNKRCAEKTMQNYHRVYYKDCNGDSNVDCVDFFRTHVAGPHLCQDNSLEYDIEWLKFLECYLNTAKNSRAALASIKDIKSG